MSAESRRPGDSPSNAEECASSSDPPETKTGGKRLRNVRSTYPRRRAVTACLTCRERKKKCDNGRPSCDFCLRLGSRCEYPGKDPSNFDAASLSILDRLAVIESLIRKDNDSSAHQGVHASKPCAFLSPQTQSLQDQTSAWAPSVACAHVRLFSRTRTDAILNWPVYKEALTSLPEWSFLDSNGTSTRSHLPVHGSFDDTSLLADTKMILQIAEGSSHLETDREVIEPLVDRYFQGVNTKNPILERSTVRQLCSDFYEQGPSWDASTCLVLIVCALGALAPGWAYEESTDQHENSGPNHASHRSKILQTAHTYFQAAEKRLGFALIEARLLSVQCIYLVGVYYMYRLCPLTALRMFHTAGNTLQTLLSMSGNDAMASAFTNDDINRAERLAWTCSKSEREILVEIPLALPSITHSKQFEHYPSPPLQPSPLYPIHDPWQQVEESSWYYYLAEIALRRIADEIVTAIYPTGQIHDFTNPAYPIQELLPAAIEFERQLEAWHQSLPSSITFPTRPQKLQSELQYFSRSRFYLVSELLRRPFICYAIHNFAKASLEVLEMARNGLSFVLNYLIVSNHYHRHHGKWFQLRHELKYACILLAAAHAGLEMPSDWHFGVERAQASANYWSVEIPALAFNAQMISVVESYCSIGRPPP